MRAKVVSVAIDPAALQHGTLTGTGQWQLSIKTNAHALAHTIETRRNKNFKKIAAVSRQEASHAVLQLTGYN